MFGDHPVELGLEQPGRRLLARLRGDRVPAAVPTRVRRRAGSVHRRTVTQALAVFERTIISARSPYDRYHYDRDDAAISPAARRGETAVLQPAAVVFPLSRRLQFLRCDRLRRAPRAGRSSSTTPVSTTSPARCRIRAPTPASTRSPGKPEDVGKFKAPTLRNIAVTAPYMHDGSIATLDDVIEHYAAGGRTIADGPESRRRPRQSEQEPDRPRVSAHRRAARRPHRLSPVADRRCPAARSAVREPVAATSVRAVQSRRRRSESLFKAIRADLKIVYIRDRVKRLDVSGG